MSIFSEDIINDILGENIESEPNEQQYNEAFAGDDDENGDENDKKIEIKVEPKKRVVRNPRQRLTVDVLKSSRGIHTIENYFKDIKFHGKYHEKADLDEILRRLQHWAHRMYPNYNFDDVLRNIERLGRKKPLQQYMQSYRHDRLPSNFEEQTEPINTEDQVMEEEPFDEFDALLGEQIAISKLHQPTSPTSSHGDMSSVSSIFNTPKFKEGNKISSTPLHMQFIPEDEELDLLNMQAGPSSSSVSTPVPLKTQNPPSKLTPEQMAKIAENRRLAQEKLKQKIQANQLKTNSL